MSKSLLMHNKNRIIKKTRFDSLIIASVHTYSCIQYNTTHSSALIKTCSQFKSMCSVQLCTDHEKLKRKKKISFDSDMTYKIIRRLWTCTFFTLHQWMALLLLLLCIEQVAMHAKHTYKHKRRVNFINDLWCQ